MSIGKVVLFLSNKFPDYDWDVYEYDLEDFYMILVNDYNFYKSKEFLKWRKIMEKKYPDTKFLTAYKRFNHGK